MLRLSEVLQNNQNQTVQFVFDCLCCAMAFLLSPQAYCNDSDETGQILRPKNVKRIIKFFPITKSQKKITYQNKQKIKDVLILRFRLKNFFSLGLFTKDVLT